MCHPILQPTQMYILDRNNQLLRYQILLELRAAQHGASCIYHVTHLDQN